jgi:hypothetical protein
MTDVEVLAVEDDAEDFGYAAFSFNVVHPKKKLAEMKEFGFDSDGSETLIYTYNFFHDGNRISSMTRHHTDYNGIPWWHEYRFVYDASGKVITEGAYISHNPASGWHYYDEITYEYTNNKYSKVTIKDIENDRITRVYSFSYPAEDKTVVDIDNVIPPGSNPRIRYEFTHDLNTRNVIVLKTFSASGDFSEYHYTKYDSSPNPLQALPFGGQVPLVPSENYGPIRLYASHNATEIHWVNQWTEKLTLQITYDDDGYPIEKRHENHPDFNDGKITFRYY